MRIQLKTLAATAALIAGIVSAPAAYADGTSKSPGSMMGHGGMMQGGQMGKMNHMMNMMGRMMGGRMSHGMMRGGQGGMMNMMENGKKGHEFGGRVVPAKHLSIDDVRHFLEHRLARRGNKRLKVGDVKEKDGDAITADILTVDDSLAERLKVDRHTGRIERVE